MSPTTALRSSISQGSSGDSFARARTVPNISGRSSNSCTGARPGTIPADATGARARFSLFAPTVLPQAPAPTSRAIRDTGGAAARHRGGRANPLGRAAGPPPRRQRLQPDCRRGDRARHPALARPNACHLAPLSVRIGVADSNATQRQEWQIVHSQLNLGDFLPRFRIPF